jgi:TetR/AcrR family transcriptional repressor of bet genes
MSGPKSGTNARASVEDLRREELVAATLATISARGFEHTTVRDIAEAAGAAVGSVNYYFKSKQDLLRAAVADSDRRFRKRVRDELVSVEGAVAKLERVAELLFLPSADEPDWAVFMDFWQQASRDETFRSIFEAANADWIELLLDVVNEGVDRGELVIHGSTRDETMALAALIDGLGLHTRVTQHIDAETACRLVKAHIDQLRR